MTKEFIKENLHTIIKMIKDFEQDARDLVHKLAQSLNLEIDTSLPVNTFRDTKEINQSGMVDENWSYFFHGMECRFRHSKTGHVVDVILTFEDEYGVLGPMFLGEYIKTNPKYFGENIAIADSYVDGTKIMEVLKEQDMLVEVRNDAQYYLSIKDELPYYVPYNNSGFKLKPISKKQI